MPAPGHIRFLLLLLLAFTLALGYGIELPVLPSFLQSLPADYARFSISRHTGILAGSYLLVIFLFAPRWGRLSDRVGRRPLILLGLGGFAAGLALLGAARSLWLVHLVQVLNGLFVAAALPAINALVGDISTETVRARRLTLLSAAILLGFLAGPALSGWLLSVPFGAAPGLRAASFPFFAAAAIGWMVWLVTWFSLFDAGPAQRPSAGGQPLPVANIAFLRLILALSGLSMFGLGAFEVGLTLQAQQALRWPPSQVSLLFMECSLVMLAVQGGLMVESEKNLYQAPMISLAFAFMAVGLLFLARAATFGGVAVWVGLIAAGSGFLIPQLIYHTSVQAGQAQGGWLGKQTAWTNLGQAVGSLSAGFLFDALQARLFWLTAGLLAVGAVAGLWLPALHPTGRKTVPLSEKT